MTDPPETQQRWLGPGVAGIGTASFLADVGHEIPTALLPNLLTTTLGAPAAALGLIEGVADGLAGATRLAGGAIADDPRRRRAQAVAGYTTTAILSSLIGSATAVWQVAVLRAGAWAARGLRVPARNALLADIVPASVYGRAYGFERAMDNLGAIVGPLLALALVGLVGVRTAIALSIIPGLLAAVAIVYAIRHAPRADQRERQPLRLRIRPVLTGRLGRLMVGVSAFEFGNVAATLLILRATELLAPGRDQDRATQLALGLYVAYNVAATVASVPAGRLGDRRGTVLVLVLGVVLFGLAYAGFAAGTTSVLALAPWFVAAGVAIGCVETAEHAAVAALAPVELRGSAFGLLAAVQSFGNLAASAIAGLLWTLASPQVAFAYLCAWMALALAGLLTALTVLPEQVQADHRMRHAGRSMVIEANKAAVRRLVDEVLNGGNLAVIDELYAPELVPAARRWITPFRASFPDVHMEIVELIAEGDKVVGRFTCSATHLGEWLGQAPTGRRFERVDEVAIFRLRDGKIVHAWSLEDTLSRLQQLGLA